MNQHKPYSICKAVLLNALLLFIGNRLSAQCFTSYSVSPGGTVCSASLPRSITLSGSQSGVLYQLQYNGANVGSGVMGTGSSITVGTITSSTANGTYVVLASKSGCSTQAVGGTVISIHPTPSGTVTASSNVICSGSGVTFTVHPSVSGTYSYQWFNNGQAIGGASASTYVATALGNYMVMIANQCGPTFITCPAITTGAATAPPGAITGPPAVTFVSGTVQQSTYTVPGSSNATSYTWSLSPASAGTISGSGTSGTVTWGTAFSGTATVNVSANGTCGSTAATGLGVSVSQVPKLVAGTVSPAMQSVGPNVVPGQLSCTLPTGGNGAYGYQWQSSLGAPNQWVNVPSGGNALTYTPPAGQTSVIFYRLRVTSGTQTAVSNNNGIVEITPCPNKSISENYILTTIPQEPIADKNALCNMKLTQIVQYFDGLGRPKQTIGIGAGGNGEDVITHIGYDAYGRQSKEYLPYTAISNGGLYRTGAEAATLSYYDDGIKYDVDFQGMTTADINPYSQKDFEASPLNRVLKQAAPGKDWKLGNGHEIKLAYQANIANEVKLYTATATWNATSGLYDIALGNGGGTVFYAANQLYKTVTFDENTAAAPTESNGSTVEFTNKEGQVVLKRTYNAGVKHDTYYVYDNYGNLTYVIPPKADTSITAAVLDDLCYQYRYDHRNRLVEKKLPGKQWEFIVYDKLDRAVATGPAASPFSDLATVGWLVTKYDAIGRPVLTGWLPATVTGATRATLQNTQNGYTANFHETKIATTANTTINGVAFRYNNVAWPTSGYHVLTVNYYDDYNYPNAPAIAASVEGEPVYYNATVKPKGLPTGTWARVLETSTLFKNELGYSFYDKKARPIRTYATNFLGGYTYTDTKLDFTGKPIYAITRHKRLPGSAELKTKEAFTYSSQGRLLTHTHQINDGAIELIAGNTYSELGQLISKKVGNTATTPTQKVDYAYNIRGWLTAINDIGALAQSGDPKDLFAFKINYNTAATGISGVSALYNGNIAETHWATNSDNGTVRSYGYKYDNLNRLTAGVYKKGTVGLDMYNESLSYDKNGNIMTLVRNGNSESTATQIDNLIYSYGPSNLHNRLTKVVDSKPNTTGLPEEFKDNGLTTDDYAYDANGNMVKDNNKNITAISYNHLNLPTKITFGTTGNIAYIYDALGQKVQKVVTVTSPVSTTTTDYLGGYQYSNTVLQFFPTAEGYVEPSVSSYKYVYQYKDHLGNVRLSYDKSLVIQEENNYYPFGLKHKGYNGNIVGVDHPYGFGGKEEQNEFNGTLQWLDFGARNYDAALGRWMNIDNHADSYFDYSPYSYTINNPVNVIDPDGNDIYLLIWFSKTGESGHAGIAIDNYKTQNKKDTNGNDVLDANGNVVTEQVADGTYTYYDLWPNNPVNPDTELQTNVTADYSNGIQINSLSDLMNTDPTTQRTGNVGAEGRSADGIVQISTTPADDEAAKKAANKEIGNKKKYNACYNNCSTFSQRIANIATGSNNQIDAKQRTNLSWIAMKYTGYKNADIIAPNNLYNAALKTKNSKKIKGPANVQAKPYLDYFPKN